MPTRRPSLASLALPLVLAACGSGPRFEVRYAPAFVDRRAAVSIVGVFRDGRMDPEAWGRMGPAITKALGAPACAAGFGDALRGADPEAYAAIDDESRANGFSDALLERLAKSARGDAMLVIAMHGRAATPPRSGPGGVKAGTPPPPSGRGHGAQRGMGVPGDIEPPGGTPGDLEVSATWFSVPKHERLATLTMKYQGDDPDAAMAELARRMGAVLPATTCGGWAWGAAAGPAVPAPSEGEAAP
jgi:hypothetical protein